MSKKEYYDDYHVRQLVERITMQMHRECWKPDYIVGLTRGGLIPAVYLSHYLDVPMYTLSVSLRDNNENGPESNLWMAEDAYGYGGQFEDTPVFDEYKQKKILIVDDINDSGATLNWIVDDWQSSCLPNCTRWESIWNNNVRFATLVDNTASKFKYSIDYAGKEINKVENDVWIVFPWER